MYVLHPETPLGCLMSCFQTRNSQRITLTLHIPVDDVKAIVAEKLTTPLVEGEHPRVCSDALLSNLSETHAHLAEANEDLAEVRSDLAKAHLALREAQQLLSQCSCHREQNNGGYLSPRIPNRRASHAHLRSTGK